MMRYNHIVPKVDGFVNDVQRGIQCNQYTSDNLVPISENQAGIVVRFLQRQGRKRFKHCTDITDSFHYSLAGCFNEMYNSSSCAGSILEGASHITSRPELFFGKAMQSRMESK